MPQPSPRSFGGSLILKCRKWDSVYISFRLVFTATKGSNLSSWTKLSILGWIILDWFLKWFQGMDLPCLMWKGLYIHIYIYITPTRNLTNIDTKKWYIPPHQTFYIYMYRYQKCPYWNKAYRLFIKQTILGIPPSSLNPGSVWIWPQARKNELTEGIFSQS